MFKFFQKHDHHGYIRFINYLRLNNEKLNGKFPTNDELEKLYDEELSKDMKYLKNCLDADDFIIYSGDLEGEEKETQVNNNHKNNEKNDDDDVPDLEETEKIIGSKTDDKKKNRRNNNRNKRNRNKKNSEDSAKNSENTNNKNGNDDNETERLRKLLQSTIIDDNKKSQKELQQNQNRAQESKHFEKERDDNYFDGYGDLSIHCEMISDFHRTETYRKGIEDSGLVKNKIVLDVGAGSGILSMFAARAGAKHVYAIEPSAVATDAQEIITENGFADKITIVRKLSEDLTLEDLGGNKPDVIISEWMGYFLYFEGMLPSVIRAREMFGNTALMLPQKCVLNLGLLTHPEYHENLYKTWTDPKFNPWNFKFSPLARYNDSAVQVDVIPHWQVTGNVQIHELDLNKAKENDVDFKSRFTFKNLNGQKNNFKIYGIVGWFSTTFTENPPIVLDTSPKQDPQTHWKQTIFMFKNPLNHKTDSLRGSISVKRRRNNRDLDCYLNLPDKKFSRKFIID